MQSLQFRQAIGATQSANEDYGASSFGNPKSYQPYEDPTFKKCPHCERTFNQEAAERHFPVCAKKAKENAMKNKKAPTQS